MNRWLRSIRAAAVLGLLWAGGGALVGGLLEFAANFFPGLNAIDMWIQPLAMLGFLSGAVFSVVLGIAARRRKFDELSVLQFAVWGALGGTLLGALFVVTGITGVLILLPLVPLSAVAASASLALARLGEKPAALPGNTDH